ncbi:GTPase IMAP family member 5 [Holothuria leucospilota]|uniref:GTPase IMAP family member 5 n=1 Tax=Holothuria leucospilota TaxID=206669 RepID=A0A9Q0YNF7_HOLLE|nr:GTPase IMAP family member 5 [Holothuria leucospilota]
MVNEKYTLAEHLPIRQSSAKGELRIVVLGKIGVGKSATANSILGQNVFFEDFNAMPTTLRANCSSRNINGTKISVIDTAGLDDPNRRREDILEDVARIMVIFSSGVHVFLYVMNAASPRFNEKDLGYIRNFEKNILGGNMKSYRALVYSHADSIKQNMDLNAYWIKQQKGGGAISSFLKEFERNVVAVNNSTSSLVERERNQTAIVSLINLLKEQNKNSLYMNDAFMKAATEREDFQQWAKRKKLNLELVAAVEKVWAAHPEIDASSTEFVNKVLFQTEVQKLVESQERGKHKSTSSIRTKRSKRAIDKIKGEVLLIFAEYEKMIEAIKSYRTLTLQNT